MSEYEDLGFNTEELLEEVLEECLMDDEDEVPAVAPVRTRKTKDNPHYVNNKEFLADIVKYRAAIKEAEEKGLKKPQIPNSIGICFMRIAENLSHKNNFMSYTFRDEMVADANENCVMYADNFDPSKGSNPFAYFTQIAYYAFLRRIGKEKKQLYVKYKATQNMGIPDESEFQDTEEGSRQFDTIGGQRHQMYDNISVFIDNFETAKKDKKLKKAQQDRLKSEGGGVS